MAEIENVIQRRFRFLIDRLLKIPEHGDHPFRNPITDSAERSKTDRHRAGFGDHHPPESVITMNRNQ